MSILVIHVYNDYGTQFVIDAKSSVHGIKTLYMKSPNFLTMHATSCTICKSKKKTVAFTGSDFRIYGVYRGIG